MAFRDRPFLLSLAILAVAVALAGCQSTAGSGAGSASVASLQAGAGFKTISAPVAHTGNDYRIGASDVLNITVFQVPELSAQSVKVSGDGTIALPLAGIIRAASLTADQLKREIVSRLARYVQTPQVSVSVAQSLSQVYTVEGEVNQPGSLPISAGRSLLEAIAAAGGFNTVANTSDVTIYRGEGSRKVATKYDVAAIRNGSAQDPEVESGDIVEVGASPVRSALQFVLPPAVSVGSAGEQVGSRVVK